MTTISTIGVIGAGTMGAGIAQVAASAGYQVALIDTTDELVQRGVDKVDAGLQRLVDKNALTTNDRDAARSRISGSVDVPSLRNANLVIEAVIESLDIKRAVFAEVDRVVSEGAILASNTSSISITALAACVSHPERFAGMHFFNPVPVLPLVEVVRGLQTDDDTVVTIQKVARTMGKTPIAVADMPGFAANRILVPMINEAIFAVADGVASAVDIDEVMKLGASHQMGPLALADLIGLDVCLHIMEVLHQDFGDDKYRPAPLLRQMVAAGLLGRKSGIGFHQYDS
ncbi:MAG: 3-hydroxybutyryl-CoA dehydrogenase [Chloroflexia bacterium]|nr:3-hydroxybutyryl-CoA dehydrogenase [Chloroflexia bacterium]